jgi:AraC-like DNA-binding protein
VINYLQASDACIPLQHHPAMLLGYAHSQDVSSASIMDGVTPGPTSGQEHETAHSPLMQASTGLPPSPIAGDKLSPTQYMRMLRNLIRALDSRDTSFLLGQQMLPGHYGDVSHALLQAGNLRQALQILVRYQSKLCPLLQPRLRDEGGIAVLYWTDSFGAPGLLPFLVEMHMAAVTGMCRWLSGERLPWRFCFNRGRAPHSEQHQMHLGGDLRFNCHLDAMLIASEWLDKPWPRGNSMAASLILQNLERDALGTPMLASLPGTLYDYLLVNIRKAPTLDVCAQAFGISPATMKRHLARHGSHFQAELDQVRTHVALYLFQTLGYDNDAVAQHLGFHDANNFRRSFKRWTGQTPSLMRGGLLDAAVKFS